MGKEAEIGAGGDKIATIAGIGLDMLGALAERFRQEMGLEFDRIWDKSLADLDGFGREMFRDLRLERESLDLNVTVLKSRYRDLEGAKNEDMLTRAFLALAEKIRALTQVYLGEKPVRDAFQAVVERLTLLEKYQQEPAVIQAMIAGLREGSGSGALRTRNGERGTRNSEVGGE